MARDTKIEVAALNVRISEDNERNYTALIQTLAELRRGVRVHGDTYLAISFFDPDANFGFFSKYTEIDIDGDWFDLEDFETASPDKIGEINIPENLRPNHSAFYFQLNPDLHVIAFSSYASSKGLSTRSVGRYFKDALGSKEVLDRFGLVESDVVKSYSEVDRILDLPELKELQLIIGRPNSDDVGKGLAEVIEERLREQNADRYEETLTARGKNSITPNERTRKLAYVAAENGQVKAKAVINGVLAPQDTSEQPLTEQQTFKSDEAREISVFQTLAARIYARISAARAAVQ